MLDRLARIMQKKTIDNDVNPNNVRQPSCLRDMTKKHQLQRITQENKRLLQRIQQVTPVIDRVEFEIRAKRNEYLVRQMSDFKEISMSPQIETWLHEKNKLMNNRTTYLQTGGTATTGAIETETDVVYTKGTGAVPVERVEYTRGEASDTPLRRSQSAKDMPTWKKHDSSSSSPQKKNEKGGGVKARPGVEKGEEEKQKYNQRQGEGGEKGRRKASATTTTTRRRRRSSKQKGIKNVNTDPTFNLVRGKASPLRGKIRPKSGRI
jgi:hypothetical protein